MVKLICHLVVFLFQFIFLGVILKSFSIRPCTTAERSSSYSLPSWKQPWLTKGNGRYMYNSQVVWSTIPPPHTKYKYRKDQNPRVKNKIVNQRNQFWRRSVNQRQNPRGKKKNCERSRKIWMRNRDKKIIDEQNIQ